MGWVILIIIIVFILYKISKGVKDGKTAKAARGALRLTREVGQEESETLKDYVVLDVETTGLEAEKEKIIEVAAIKVRDEIEVGRYTTFVNPEKALPLRITELTGIRPDQVKNAKPYNEMSSELSSFIEELPIVAHNSQFDVKFISTAFILSGITKNIHHVDTIKLAKKAFPDMSNYKLNTLIKELNISDSSQTHRAMDDVDCTIELYRLCKKTISAQKELSAEIRQAKNGVSSLEEAKSAVDIFLAYEKVERTILKAREKNPDCAEVVFGPAGKYLKDNFSSAISNTIEKDYSKEKTAIQKLKTQKAINDHIDRFVNLYQSNEEKLNNVQKGKIGKYKQDLIRIGEMVSPS